jgi:hypothetical protein
LGPGRVTGPVISTPRCRRCWSHCITDRWHTTFVRIRSRARSLSLSDMKTPSSLLIFLLLREPAFGMHSTRAARADAVQPLVRAHSVRPEPAPFALDSSCLLHAHKAPTAGIAKFEGVLIARLAHLPCAPHVSFLAHIPHTHAHAHAHAPTQTHTHTHTHAHTQHGHDLFGTVHQCNA